MKTFHKILSIVLLISISLLFTQCFPDKGNYDYIELDRVTIDIAGTGVGEDLAITIERGNTLQITPRVLLNGVEVDENNPLLSFRWIAFGEGVINTPENWRDTLGESIALDAIIGLPMGASVLMFVVTHNETGLQEYIRFRLTIEGGIPSGWMILYERDGNTDVGVIANDWITRGITEERVLLDIFSFANGELLSGRPIGIIHSQSGLAPHHVLIASENDMVAVNNMTFETWFTFEELTWGNAPVKRLNALNAGPSMRDVAIINNRVHTCNLQMMGAMTRNVSGFGLPRLPDPDLVGLTHGKLALIQNFSTALEAVVYDQTYQRFLGLPMGAMHLRPFLAQDQENYFDVNDVGMELLMSDFGHGRGAPVAGAHPSTYTYSIMRDGGNHWLLIANFHAVAASDPHPQLNIGVSVDDPRRINRNISRGKHNMSSAPGIANVSSMAVPQNGIFIYYSSENTLHIFRYLDGSTEVAWTAPPGEVITTIRLQTFYNNARRTNATLGMLNLFELIHIGTWNENTQTGSVHQFRVDQVSGSILGEGRTYTGFGRIADMGWLTR